MQVKMRAELSGLRDGAPWPPIGGVINLPDDEAAHLLRNGSAEPVFDPESGVERAVAPAAEVRDTSARDALVPSTTKRTRQRNLPKEG